MDKFYGPHNTKTIGVSSPNLIESAKTDMTKFGRTGIVNYKLSFKS